MLFADFPIYIFVQCKKYFFAFFNESIFSYYMYEISIVVWIVDFDRGPRWLFKYFGVLTKNSVLKEGSIYLFTFQFLQKGCFYSKMFLFF